MRIDERYKRIISTDARDWLGANAAAEISQVLLNPPANLGDLAGDLADQLLSRRKARKKLPVWYENSDILWPPPVSIEQASSAVTAQYKAGLVKGEKITDLTGGSGIDLLAFSENFGSVTYIEQDEWLCKVFLHNASCLGKTAITVRHTSAELSIEHLEKGQWVYLDPARRDSAKKKVFLLEDCSPNVLELLPKLKSKGVRILLKLSPMLDLKHVMQELVPSRMIVLSVQNEVKELLVIIDDKNDPDAVIEAVNLVGDEHSRFKFRFSEEDRAIVNTSAPATYLYEPNAAIMKAGAFKMIANAYGLAKLHPNTHLYTGEELIYSFPGRIFKFMKKVTGAELKARYQKTSLHVMTRNYPQPAYQLTTKYKLQESGDQYLIAFTDYQDKKQLIITEKIKIDQT